MARILVHTKVSLDGVMQSPAAPGEDTRGGFQQGGWANAYTDDVMLEATGASAGGSGAMLFGRRTYEHFATVWPHMPEDVPYTAVLNNSMKYVGSTTLREPLPWRNSTLLSGDTMAAVAGLKKELDQDLVVLGSGELTRSLLRHGLVDRVTLEIHPLVLGSGLRLFADGSPYVPMRLVDTLTTTTGVMISTYEPTGQTG